MLDVKISYMPSFLPSHIFSTQTKLTNLQVRIALCPLHDRRKNKSEPSQILNLCK